MHHRYEWQARLAGMEGTPAAIEAHAREICLAVRSVDVETIALGQCRITVHLKWWAWLSFGVVTRINRNRMRSTDGAWLAAGVTAIIR
jgi:hypothetical protein